MHPFAVQPGSTVMPLHGGSGTSGYIGASLPASTAASKAPASFAGGAAAPEDELLQARGASAPTRRSNEARLRARTRWIGCIVPQDDGAGTPGQAPMYALTPHVALRSAHGARLGPRGWRRGVHRRRAARRHARSRAGRPERAVHAALLG